MRRPNLKAKALSEIVTDQPEGEKLIAKDQGIEIIDLVKWNPSQIKYISLEFNNLEVVGALGQFENLVGVDLSNNNVL